MTPIEVIASISGLLCVWLTVKQNIWCWPIGLVQVLLYIYIFVSVKLYSDALLQIFFVAISIYGWHQWLHGGKNRRELRVTSINTFFNRSLWSWVAVVILVFPLMGYCMGRFLGASAPYADAFTTVASIVATYLMAKKYLQCWLFWITVDVIAIGVYIYKDLYITSGLYAVFLVLATLGYKTWRKSYETDIRVGSNASAISDYSNFGK